MLTSQFNSSRPYGNLLHEGVDYDILDPSPDSKEPVLCLFPGTVYRSENINSAYGNFVVIEHVNNGSVFYTWYCHMDSRFVSVGEAVNMGHELGELGGTGGFPEHVHLNLQVPGYGLSGYVVSDVVNPAPFIGLAPLGTG